MLRKRVPKKHIFLKPDERALLIKLGKELGPSIRHLITIVDYSTYRRWVRKEDPSAVIPRKGRPRIAKLIRDLIIQMAKETGWGYTRILGEIRKLNLGKISRQSVKNILVEHGLDPGPKRGKGTWSEFLRIHAETLWQVDFFSKQIWTLKGPQQVFAMVFLHVGTRRVFVTPGTYQPDAAWMKLQAEAFFQYTQTEELGCRFLIRDMDKKYTSDFDRLFKDRKIAVMPVGPRKPNLNAFVERWIQGLKIEALAHFITFSLAHFDYIVGEYVSYFHQHRPHQGIGNQLIYLQKLSDQPPITSLEQVKCERRLGGILKHYYCAA
jgi:putative transposase